jgi:hypothetical protein
MKRLNSLVVAFALLASLVPAARAGDFMDTRISFILSEDNFFAGPGESMINSPGTGFEGGKQNTQFFDNYDTKFTGFETMSHLVIYKKMPAFFDNLTTEASLAIRFYMYGDPDVRRMIYDTGSYIRLTYDLSCGTEKDKNLQLVVFPVSGDRFRLGYSYKISWGGDGVFPLHSNLAPAAKLQLTLPFGYAFIGMKTTQISENLKDNPDQTEMVTNYGVLGGLGVDIMGIRAEVNGGFFTRGVFAHEGLKGESVYGAGVSYQVGYHQGMDIGTSIDFALYRNDPEIETKFFKPEKYGEGLSFSVKHEGSFLVQTLEDPARYGTTVNQWAYAFDLNLAMKIDFWRIHADAMFRTLSFMLYEVPSFTPYQDFPADAKVQPEIFGAIGADYHFENLHLTPGLVAGIQRPATFTIDNLNVGGAQFPGKRTVVVWDVATKSILPQNEDARLVYSFKATCRWDLSEILAVVGELYYTYDNNRVRFVDDGSGLAVAMSWDKPHILGFNLVAQARF